MLTVGTMNLLLLFLLTLQYCAAILLALLVWLFGASLVPHPSPGVKKKKKRKKSKVGDRCGKKVVLRGVWCISTKKPHREAKFHRPVMGKNPSG